MIEICLRVMSALMHTRSADAILVMMRKVLRYVGGTALGTGAGGLMQRVVIRRICDILNDRVRACDTALGTLAVLVALMNANMTTPVARIVTVIQMLVADVTALDADAIFEMVKPDNLPYGKVLNQ